MSKEENMPNYKKMYLELFNTVTDIIEQLQEVQKKTEQMYIEAEKDEKTIIKINKD